MMIKVIKYPLIVGSNYQPQIVGLNYQNALPIMELNVIGLDVSKWSYRSYCSSTTDSSSVSENATTMSVEKEENNATTMSVEETKQNHDMNATAASDEAMNTTEADLKTEKEKAIDKFYKDISIRRMRARSNFKYYYSYQSLGNKLMYYYDLDESHISENDRLELGSMLRDGRFHFSPFSINLYREGVLPEHPCNEYLAYRDSLSVYTYTLSPKEELMIAFIAHELIDIVCSYSEYGTSYYSNVCKFYNTYDFFSNTIEWGDIDPQHKKLGKLLK